MESDSADVGCSLGCYVSNKLLGDADAAATWRPVCSKIVRFLRPALPRHLETKVWV